MRVTPRACFLDKSHDRSRDALWQVSADQHEEKLRAECEVLIRIVRDRCDVMTSKIKQSKVGAARCQPKRA